MKKYSEHHSVIFYQTFLLHFCSIGKNIRQIEISRRKENKKLIILNETQL